MGHTQPCSFFISGLPPLRLWLCSMVGEPHSWSKAQENALLKSKNPSLVIFYYFDMLSMHLTKSLAGFYVTSWNKKKKVRWACYTFILTMFKKSLKYTSSFQLDYILYVWNKAGFIFKISAIREITLAAWQSCHAWKKGLTLKLLAIQTFEVLGNMLKCVYTSL